MRLMAAWISFLAERQRRHFSATLAMALEGLPASCLSSAESTREIVLPGRVSRVALHQFAGGCEMKPILIDGYAVVPVEGRHCVCDRLFRQLRSQPSMATAISYIQERGRSPIRRTIYMDKEKEKQQAEPFVDLDGDCDHVGKPRFLNKRRGVSPELRRRIAARKRARAQRRHRMP